MYLLNQEKPWYLSDEWYVTVEEFDAIRRMNFPKDFIDFFEIAFRTGLHEKDILNLKKENITLVKDENNNIVSGRIYGNSIKFKTPINVKLDQKSLSILTNRMESTKIEFLFVNELNHPYSILYPKVFCRYWENAFCSISRSCYCICRMLFCRIKYRNYSMDFGNYFFLIYWIRFCFSTAG